MDTDVKRGSNVPPISSPVTAERAKQIPEELEKAYARWTEIEEMIN